MKTLPFYHHVHVNQKKKLRICNLNQPRPSVAPGSFVFSRAGLINLSASAAKWDDLISWNHEKFPALNCLPLFLYTQCLPLRMGRWIDSDQLKIYWISTQCLITSLLLAYCANKLNIFNLHLRCTMCIFYHFPPSIMTSPSCWRCPTVCTMLIFALKF